MRLLMRLKLKENKMECQCPKCKSACNYKPGWFAPGEVEKVAEYKKISLKELFDQYLGVDWWEKLSGNIYLLAPAITEMNTGEQYPQDPKGKCIFYKNELCEIHPVKPFECAQWDHTITTHNLHKETAMKWNTPKCQKQITKLLGEQPY